VRTGRNYCNTAAERVPLRGGFLSLICIQIVKTINDGAPSMCETLKQHNGVRKIIMICAIHLILYILLCTCKYIYYIRVCVCEVCRCVYIRIGAITIRINIISTIYMYICVVYTRSVRIV